MCCCSQINYGDGNAHSILDMLYNHYREFNQFENGIIKECFDNLYSELNHLTLIDTDKVTDIVCSLCGEHERLAFSEGTKVGVHLGMELYK